MKKTLVMSVLAMSMGVTAFAAGSLATVPDADKIFLLQKV